jgi:hypothetical protein
MIRIALAVVAAVVLTFAADAQTVGPLCQDAHGSLLVCYSGHAVASRRLVPSVRTPMALCLSVTPGTAASRRSVPSVRTPMALCLSALGEVDP